MVPFKVGDEVVCVIGGRLGDSSPRLTQFPTKGQTYHVRGLQQTPYKYLTGQCGVLLEEIVNDINENTGEEWDYFSRRFRKAVKQKTENKIEVFEKLLNTKDAPQELWEEEKEKVKVPEKVE